MNDQLTIAIPTYQRERVVTYKHIPDQYLPRTFLACPSNEAKDWTGAGYNVWSVPRAIKGISKTRAWLLKNCPTRFLMMLDDDMDFCYRTTMKSPKLETLDPSTIRGSSLMTQMIQQLMAWLTDGFVHVGISARQGNNTQDSEYVDATRMMNAYGYDTDTLAKLPVKLGRMEVMEDFDLTLQLLRLGYANRVTYRWCWNQRGSNAKGGCSEYRTAEMQAKAAHTLAKLHHPYVKIVERKGWKNMETRTDVRVAWKKAFAEGVSKRD